ncbi:phage resistance protein [Rhodococcoides corynebacterioides]|uniref:phage resistance protein n=1 Tax=Rhodococcoides corynebacterioides TaxID=53972 RepID=UPI001C9A5526|nr:phage resistance protein [Rhodococcus corynebacterioides]MBY6363249.1 phage resistance protein [Rhodococcus corynebacterioides]
MTTHLLKDLIDIPERAGTDDYVLRLTSSTDDDAHLAATLGDYVLTDSLTENFTAAIDLVADAVRKNASRASYLTGSFGSGKSHFMAVLFALLGNHAAARTDHLRELTGRYDEQLSGMNLLRLTYHLLGAKSLEDAVFKGYLEQVRRLHPDSPLPAVHVTDELLSDADNLRQRLGDDAFLSGLGASAADEDGWGGLVESDWTVDEYTAARHASPEDPRRRSLVSALVETYFRSFTENATYIDLDRGLVAITDHAKSLGYDGVVLFLDELVLWLAFAVRDNEFFARESQKITKLVESSGTRRAIPLISFVSRQMDLRKWFADAGASGAEQDALDRAFHYQQGRFAEIKLGDDNLAEVAHARLLRPKNPEAAAIIQAAFSDVTRKPEVWDILRDSLNTSDEHRGASEKEFRLTYPFSPVLVSTLRNLSAVMQRERTALKVMQRMLVDRRNTLTVDDLIPVGDAFEYVVSGNTPIDSHAQTMFKAATDLFTTKLRPALMSKHEVSDLQLTEDPESVPTGYRGQERIAKTLLLAAVAPKVPALRDIDSSRLAALNHGSIKSRMAGGEARTVLGVIRDWQRDIPEISLGDGTNPVIRVQLADVDYQSVIDRIGRQDSMGARRQLVRDLVHKALGVSTQSDLGGAAVKLVTWRGSRREVDVVFGNVRDASSLPEASFDSRPGTWRIVVDYPFDEAGFTSEDDIARVDRLVGSSNRRTIVWLPRFFSEKATDELALLVKLNWLFTGIGDRWRENTDHLSASDQAQARGILENLYRGTLASFELLLKQAYGIDTPDKQRFVEDLPQYEALTSLSRELRPLLPIASDLSSALDKIVDQAFTNLFPKHPEFSPADEEVSLRQLETVRNYVESAASHREGRVPTEPGLDRKACQRIAGVLQVGKATEDHFLFGPETFAFWAGELDRAETDGRVTVGALQQRIDNLAPAWGLRPEVRDLVVFAWTQLRKRAWVEAGQAIAAPPLGKFRPSIELRAEALPEESDWERARDHATKLLGYTLPRTFLTGANAAEFAAQVRSKASDSLESLSRLIPAIGTAERALELPESAAKRSGAVIELHAALDHISRTSDNVELIAGLAALQVSVPLQTAALLRSSAERDRRALESFHWVMVGTLIRGTTEADPRGEEARNIFQRLTDTVSTPDGDLAQRLTQLSSDLAAWISGPTPPPPPPKPHSKVVTTPAELTELIDSLRSDPQRYPITVSWTP